MEAIRSFVRERPLLVCFVTAFVLGTLFGLIVLGWCVFPVQWYDTDLEDLRIEHVEEYLDLVADSYAQTSDLALAMDRVQRLQGPQRSQYEIIEVMKGLAEKRQKEGKSPEAQRLSVLAAAISLRTTASAVAPPPKTSRLWTTLSGIFSRVKGLALPLGIAVLLVLVGVPLLILLRRRPQAASFSRVTSVLPRKGPSGGEVEVIEGDFESFDDASSTPVDEQVLGAELGYFQAVYHEGDDDFDAQFPIQGADGEFLGECGVGVRELLDQEESNRVAVFEVWLFDKHDIRTVIGMFASEYAYQDEVLRTSLSARGKVALVLPGGEIELETMGLHLRARVREASYGRDPKSAPRSFFSRLVVDLLVDPASS